jgi:hypothetical protein
MPLSDHIKLKPDPELALMLELKYGKPQPTEEWFAALPPTVLDLLKQAIGETHVYASRWSTQDLCQVLANQVLHYPEKHLPMISEALHKYHSLLGRV